MSTNKSLDLLDCPRTLVFRRIEQILRTNKTLERVFAERSWKTYSGAPSDASAFGVTACPWIVMSRVPGPEDYWSADAMTGDMEVLLQVGIRGFCEDDADNLFWAIQRAIYPPTQSERKANALSLVAVGAQTGIVTFTQPFFDARGIEGQASDGMIVARGRMKITVVNTF